MSEVCTNPNKNAHFEPGIAEKHAQPVRSMHKTGKDAYFGQGHRGVAIKKPITVISYRLVNVCEVLNQVQDTPYG